MEGITTCSQPVKVDTKLDRRLILPAFVIVSLDAASSGAVLAILPFLLKGLGATPLIFGVVLGAEALCQFAAAPWIGQLSDRYGRKRVLLASQFGALVSLALLASATSVVFVLLARVLLGLTAANFAAAAAYAADNSAVSTRRQAIGILSAGLGLGGIVGPSLSGYLADISLSTPIWLALGITVTSMTVTALFLRNSQSPTQVEIGVTGGTETHTKTSMRSVLSAPAVRVLVVIFLCHYFSYGMFSSQLGIFLSETFRWNGHSFGPKEFGYILSADGIINVCAQLFLLKWLGSRFTDKGLITLIFAMLITGYLICGMATSVPVLAIAVLFVSTGVALARPTFVAALSLHVPQDRQGIVMGATQSLVAITDIASPVVAGFILGGGLPAVWIGLVVGVASFGALIARQRLSAS